MGPVGWQEMVVIFLVALVLFGPKKLPELGRTLGKAITEFRRASNELKSTFEREMQQLERENESLKEVTSGFTNEIQNTYNGYTSYESGYDSPYYDSGAYGSGSNDSASSHPTTTGESAVQDAGSENHGGAEAQQPGTVARTPGTELASAEPSPATQPPSNGTQHAADQEAHRS